MRTFVVGLIFSESCERVEKERERERGELDEWERESIFKMERKRESFAFAVETKESNDNIYKTLILAETE
jgi:hypothetical protein